MANAKIDNNRENTTIVTDTNGNPANLLVDPTTGRLLIDIAIVEDSTPVLNSSKIDGNYEETSLADNGTDPVPLLIDNRNGYLFVDVLNEDA